MKPLISWLSSRANEVALVIAILIVVGVTIFADSSQSYLHDPKTSAEDILRNAAMLTIFALGASVVIIAGGIDLSAGSMIAFSGTTIACTMLGIQSLGTFENPVAEWKVVSGGIAAGLFAGFVVGTLHAWLITSVGLPPFVATLATLVGLRSLARVMGETVTQLLLSGKKSQIPIEQPFFTDFLRQRVDLWIYTAIGLAVFTFILLGYTILGRHLYALGGNEQAARLSGLRTDRLKWFAYVFGAMTASLASIFYLANEGVSAPVTQARGHELNAIAAAVVGGCSLKGGVGTVTGTLLGAMFLRVVIDAVAKIIKSGADVWEGLIVGVVVVLAVTFSQLRMASNSGRSLLGGLLGACAIFILSTTTGMVAGMNLGAKPGVAIGVVSGMLLGILRWIESYRGRAARLETMSIAPIIELKAIGKNFPGVRALSDISFSVAPGELHAICGENGAGKSTLMKILSGVITDYEGTLSIEGKDARFSGTADAERASISIIHQELNLVEQLSVAANIFLGRELTVFPAIRNDRAMNRAAASLLQSLECDISPTMLAGSLRVGDQQLVEIAKALSLRSRILIMDEPTSALTESEVARLYRVIAKLLNDGTTILYISHKMDEVFRLSNRITVLRDGRFIATRNREETNAEEITRLMVGRELSSHESIPRNVVDDCVLEVQSLSLAWPGHARGYRLNDISFKLGRGEILGIAGLMGAGRTELLECLFGASDLAPSGKILLDGKPIAPRHPSEACRHGIALVTEDRKRLGLFPELSVGKNISMCSLHQTLTSFLISQKKERTASQSMVQKLQVKTASLNSGITSLSGGNQQKCILGRWLLTNPKVLLLDDPTRGIDVGAKAELYRLIQTLCSEGLSVIVTSSEMPELLALCDRIMVLNEGRQTAMFERANATQQLIMHAAAS